MLKLYKIDTLAEVFSREFSKIFSKIEAANGGAL